jgi:signal transduction histidine kinase
VPRPPLPDLALALVLFLVAVAEVLGAPIAEDVVRGGTALNLAAVAVATLPLAFRRRAPLVVAALVLGAWAGRAVAGPPLEIYPLAVASIVAVYSVAAYGSLRDALLGYGLLALTVAVAAEAGTGGDAAPDVVPSLVLAGGVWLVGRIARRRHDAALQVERRADERAEEAATLERERIAREMHDAVSHSLASIVMQAGGAQDVLERDPQRAGAALASIESTARQGLGEMRRLLGLLGDGGAPRDPQPGLARLGELLDGARRAGLEVESTVAGDRRPLPPAVDVSAYRIVQEALTNSMKHAGRCRATVVVRFGEGDLELEIADDGPGAAASDGRGRGLAGMRERVAVLGGAFSAGPRPDGSGFRVSARIPA